MPRTPLHRPTCIFLAMLATLWFFSTGLLAQNLESPPGREQAALLQDLDLELQRLLVQVREGDPKNFANWRQQADSLNRQLEQWQAENRQAENRQAKNRVPDRKLEVLQRLSQNLEIALDLHQRGNADAVANLRARQPLPTSRSQTAPAKSAPANDACSDALRVREGEVVTGSLRDATQDGEGGCDVGGTPDIWFRYTATRTGFVGFDSSGSNFDTVLSVHVISDSSQCPGITANQAVCNDDGYGLQATAYAFLEYGTEVFVRLSGFDASSTGDYRLQVGRFPYVTGHVVSDVDGSGVPSEVYLCSHPSGFFRDVGFSGLLDGTYVVGASSGPTPGLDNQDVYLHTARADDHLDETYDDLPHVGRRSVCGPEQVGTALQLRTGQTLTDIDFVLATGGRLSGQVRHQDGSSATEVEVRAFTADGRLHDHTLTDAEDGSYRFEGMASGDYFVHVQRTAQADGVLYDDLPCPPGCDPLGGTPVAVQEGQETAGIDLVLPDGVHIRGRVTDDDGRPLGGITVAGSRADGREPARFAVTNNDGEYILRNLPPWVYLLHVNNFGFEEQYFDGVNCGDVQCAAAQRAQATALDLQPGGQHHPAAQADFELSRSPTSTIEGRLSDLQGKPLEGHRVRAFSPTGGNRSATAKVDGSYRLRTQAGETYYLYTQTFGNYLEETYGGAPCPGFSDSINESPCDPLQAIPLVAQDLPLTGIDFQLASHPKIRGRVTDMDGQPVAGVDVITMSQPDFSPGARYNNQTTTGADGSYELPAAVGEHFLLFQRGIHPQFFGGAPCDSPSDTFACTTDGATAVDVPAGGLEGVDLQALAFGNLQGRVTDRPQGDAALQRQGRTLADRRRTADSHSP